MCIQAKGSTKCTVCIKRKRVCHFDKSLYITPYQRVHGKKGRYTKRAIPPKPQSVLVDLDEPLTSEDDENMSELESENTKKVEKLSPKPCRRCYYDGRICRRSLGEDEACDKCSQVNQRCNPNLTGIQPWKRYKNSRKRQRVRATVSNSFKPVNINVSSDFVRTSAMSAPVLQKNPGKDPLVTFAAWLPKVPAKPNPEPRPCRRCFNEGHFCYKSQGSENPCDSCIGNGTCNPDLTGIIPWRYRRYQKKQQAREELQGSSVAALEVFKTPLKFPRSMTKHESLKRLDEKAGGDAPDLLIQFKDWRAGPPRAELGTEYALAARPCRRCFIDGINCYKRSGSMACRRCENKSTTCTKDLSGAQPYKYQRAYGDMRIFTGPGDATGVSQDEQPLSGSDQDWSTDSGDASNEEDIGLKALRYYLENLPRSKYPEFQSKMPCRRCLQTRAACDMLPGGMGKCRVCDYGKTSKQCNPSLYGARPYPGKYPDLEVSLNRQTSTTKIESRLSQDLLAAYKSTDSEAAGNEASQKEGLDQFEDNDDSGLRLLRWYMRSPPQPKEGVDERFVRRIPCRRCLIQRRACFHDGKSLDLCQNCRTARKSKCSFVLSGIHPYARSWGKHLDGYDDESAKHQPIGDLGPVSESSDGTISSKGSS